ncbi:recombinase family protein [Porcipelethomonas sp.]|uniref:recombinase family protein n=1 Tax=Porcipelethomonas sp. TaxID=2981675 RepID=UPI00307A229C
MNPNVTVIQPTIAAGQEQKIRVAAYCRVSSDSANQLNSFMAQMRYYENFLADSKTETLVSVYADEGVTGTRMDKREDFRRMLKDCRRGKIDRIISKSISRFARNTKECLTVLRELKFLGITVLFEKETKNLKWSYQKRMKSGQYITSCAPFGYNLIDGKLYINESEAKIVSEIFDYFLNGHGIQSTTEYFNEVYAHIKKWSLSSMRYLLTNEKYIGDSMLQKYYTPDEIGAKHQENKNAADKYYIENTHKSIISKNKFYAVQNLLNSRRTSKMSIGSYPLSQKLKCRTCGLHFRRKLCRGIVYWTCNNHDKHASICNQKRIPEIAIYQAFICLYNKLKCNFKSIFPSLLSQLQELKNRKFSGNQQYMEIAKEIAKLKEQTHVLARLKTKGFLDEAKYLEQTAEINSKINKLSREQRKIVRSDDEDDMIEQIKDIASIIENGMDLMTEFDEVLFESLVEKIIVINRNELEFNLYGGLKFTERSV